MLREVKIKPVLNGWIVEVGCQTVVFDDPAKMLTSIRDYLENPEVAESWWRENAVNAKWMSSLAEAQEIDPVRFAEVGHSIREARRRIVDAPWPLNASSDEMEDEPGS